MDPGDDCAAPRSDGRGSGSGSDGNGGRSENTSSRRRRHMPSSSTGTQLMLEFNAAGDDGATGSSASPPSSGALDLEALPTPNQVRVLSLVSTDNTIIMEGELLDDDNEPGTSSGTRRSASLVDNSGLDTSASARRSTSVDNNGPRPSNRVSTSNLDLVLVSSGSQGSSGGGSGRRRNPSNYQVPQRAEQRWRQGPRNNRHFEVGGSSNWQPWQWHSYNIHIPPQQGQELPYPFNSHQAPDFHHYSYPPNMNYQQVQVVPGFPAGPAIQVPPQYGYGYPTLPSSIYVAFEATPDSESTPLEVIPARRSSGQYPPPGVTIRAPPTSSGDPPPQPEQPVGTRVTITAPPASEAPRQPEPTPSEQTVPSTVTIKALPVPAGEGTSSSPPKQPEPEATPLAPKPEQPATRPLPPDPSGLMFLWNQTQAVLLEMAYGPRPTRRLPVFQGICPDEGTSDPPPAPTTSQPPSPPPSPPPPPPRSP